MNGVLENVSTVLFFACVPVLLVVRFLRPALMPWFLLVAIAGILCGVFELLNAHFANAQAADLIERAGGLNHASPELVARWANSESKADAFIGGSVRGVYLLGPGLVVYVVADLIRKAWRS